MMPCTHAQCELPKTRYRRTSENTPSSRCSPSQASELFLQKRVVLRAFLLAFPPLHVVLNPRVVAFRDKAQEGVLRRNAAEVHQAAALGALLEHAPLPILGHLKAMITVCQLPKLLAGLGAGGGLKP